MEPVLGEDRNHRFQSRRRYPDGLAAYCDIGAGYVTQKVKLTRDIRDLYGNLSELNARTAEASATNTAPGTARASSFGRAVEDMLKGRAPQEPVATSPLILPAAATGGLERIAW